MDVETLRDFCLKLPSATEDIKWGNDLVFSIGGKMFCITGFEQPFKCSFKVKEEEFEEISIRKGFVPAPYMARAKWVLVNNESGLTKKEWEKYIVNSYDMIKAKLTKKQKHDLGLL